MEEQQNSQSSSNPLEHFHSDFFTVDEISKAFDEVQERCFRYDEECTDQGIAPYMKTIGDLNKIQQSIIRHSLFSINEELNEIATENLKYLLVPYYMGYVYSRINEDRKKKLEFSQLFLSEFLKLLNHYELVNKEVKKQWKNLSDDNNYQITRDEKIATYKEQKNLENKLKNLEKIKEESDRREIITTQINICIYKSIDLLRSNVQEVEILDYKEKIENDPKAKEQHEKIMNRPLPKPTVTKISKPDDKSVPFMLEQNKGKVDYLCHGCAYTMGEKRQELMQQVFTPGTTMPTVSLDQLADIEIGNMQKMKDSEEAAKKRQQEQEDADSDRDSVGDAKQEEARRWDDWKDENEKGAGNRFGK
ncbi:TAP42 protein (macronuclear) [Tetrahymena thermophila SB210]|uniref:TAP42 protein n=1 Tax=Tetrahymena thermophila (strain SB210) TaxID=312017 RepID=Q23TE6_TETTS|nr:TAP42 protein [Tetrahymena thermophila SB210]EAR99760.2 TAP42 protein [Tetrahymena thermophila SB210]|eukprot:XP_001020005.2 TAP42 protein [Tetrahymena thermophila SB210]